MGKNHGSMIRGELALVDRVFERGTFGHWLRHCLEHIRHPQKRGRVRVAVPTRMGEFTR
jgi:hypothetical protein